MELQTKGKICNKTKHSVCFALKYKFESIFENLTALLPRGGWLVMEKVFCWPHLFFSVFVSTPTHSPVSFKIFPNSFLEIMGLAWVLFDRILFKSNSPPPTPKMRILKFTGIYNQIWFIFLHFPPLSLFYHSTNYWNVAYWILRWVLCACWHMIILWWAAAN